MEWGPPVWLRGVVVNTLVLINV